MTNLSTQEPWELRGTNDARIRALEVAGPRTSFQGVTPAVTGAGAGPTLVGTLSVPAVPFLSWQIPTAQLLMGGSATNDQFEIGIYNGATTAGTLLRAIRWTNQLSTNVNQRDVAASGVLVPANTAKTYTLWVSRTGGAGTFGCVGDPRYSVFHVEIRLQMP